MFINKKYRTIINSTSIFDIHRIIYYIYKIYIVRKRVKRRTHIDVALGDVIRTPNAGTKTWSQPNSGPMRWQRVTALGQRWPGVVMIAANGSPCAALSKVADLSPGDLSIILGYILWYDWCDMQHFDLYYLIRPQTLYMLVYSYSTHYMRAQLFHIDK